MSCSSRSATIFATTACVVVFVMLAAPSALAQTVQASPRNPAFDAWRTGRIPQAKSGDFAGGYVPLPWRQAPVVEAAPGAPGAKDLQPSYDLRTLSEVTGVRNQLGCGSCWAFSTYGSMEGWLIKNLAQTWNLSENNLKNYHGFDLGPCDGGHDYMSCAYLARGSGPVLEADDPYNDWDDRPSPGGPKRKTLEFMQRFHTSELIKEAIMTHGALSTALWWDADYYNSTDRTYYYGDSFPGDGELAANHAVTLVGWDDNKVVTGGSQHPPGLGAWIIKNSWGSSWGEIGYFYISYYDTNAVVPTGGAYLFGPAEEPTEFGRIYQYDELGQCYSIGYLGVPAPETCWGANVFTAEADEDLTAVAFYTTGPDSTYTVYVYDTFDGSSFSNLLASKSGSLPLQGYHTVAFDAAVSLTLGDDFALVLRVTTTDAVYPLAVEGYMDGYSSNVEVSAGESYTSDNGTDWQDGIDVDGGVNVCLKGFTSGVPDGTVATPSFYPLAGPYTNPVAIYCSTDGATIHYTLDESEPTEASPAYASPIVLTETTTITTRAFKTDMTASAVVSATYLIGGDGPICEALDDCDLMWVTGGQGVWTNQIFTTHDGEDAAQSPDIADDQESYILATFTGPGQVSFWWKTSSEPVYDALRLDVDSEPRMQISGNTAWQYATCGIGPGEHIVRWTYSKDFIDTYYQDCGWVDEVAFTPTGTAGVADSVLPADDLEMAFPEVQVGQSHTEQVVVQNTSAEHDLSVTSIDLFTPYLEDFSSGVAAGWLPLVASEWSVESGEYRAQSAADTFMQSGYAGQKWRDCAFQVTVRRTGDELNSGGVAFRVSDDFYVDSFAGAGSAYILNIGGDGYYMLFKLVDGSPSLLAGWTYTPYLNPGTLPNDLLVSIQGSTIYLYFNGHLAWAGSDSSISAAGRIGLFGYTETAWQTVYYFDDVQAMAPVQPTKSAIGAVQQWYNANPVSGGSLARAPETAPPVCPFTEDAGAEALQLPEKGLPGGFTLANVPTLPAVLTPGGSLTFDVAFAPGWFGEYEKSLVIRTNDATNPQVEVSLSGTATGSLPAAGLAGLALLAAAFAGSAAYKIRRRR